MDSPNEYDELDLGLGDGLINKLSDLADSYHMQEKYESASDIRRFLIDFYVGELNRMDNMVLEKSTQRSSKEVLDNIDEITQELKRHEDDSEAVQDSQADGDGWTER